MTPVQRYVAVLREAGVGRDVIDALCGLCGHYMGEFNKHGFDQNDGVMDEAGKFVHGGRCTYCRACNERIVAAAIRRKGVVFTGAHHHQIIRYMAVTLGLKTVTGEQGFVTSAGHFVSRATAARIALASGQRDEDAGSLFSEQLWSLPDPLPEPAGKTAAVREAAIKRMVRDIVNVEGEDVQARRLGIAELYVCAAERGAEAAIRAEIDLQTRQTIDAAFELKRVAETKLAAIASECGNSGAGDVVALVKRVLTERRELQGDVIAENARLIAMRRELEVLADRVESAAMEANKFLDREAEEGK